MKRNEKKPFKKLVEITISYLANEATMNNPVWVPFMENDKMKNVVIEIMKLCLKNNDSIYTDLTVTRYMLLGAIAKTLLTLGHRRNNRVVISEDPRYIAKRLENLARTNNIYAEAIRDLVTSMENLLPQTVFTSLILYMEVDLHEDFVDPECFEDEVNKENSDRYSDGDEEVLASKLAFVERWLSQWSFPRTPIFGRPYYNGDYTFIFEREKGIVMFPISVNGTEEKVFIDLSYDSEWSMDGDKEGIIKFQSVSLLDQECECRNKIREILAKQTLTRKTRRPRR